MIKIMILWGILVCASVALSLPQIQFEAEDDGAKIDNKILDILKSSSEMELKCFGQQQVFYNGKCADLLSSDVCEEKEWLILEENSEGRLVPVCRERKCIEPQIYSDKDCKCHEVDDSAICEENEELFLDVFGRGTCQCAKGYLYAEDGTCKQVYRENDCPPGKIAVPDKVSGLAVCQSNDCPSGKLHLIWAGAEQNGKNNSRCYTIGEQGPCPSGFQVDVNPGELVVDCVESEISLRLFDLIGGFGERRYYTSNTLSMNNCFPDRWGRCRRFLLPPRREKRSEPLTSSMERFVSWIYSLQPSTKRC